MTDFTPQLHEAVDKLTNALSTLRPMFDASSSSPSCSDLFAYHAPVIDDRLGNWTSDEPLGLRKFVDSLEAHLAILEEMLSSSNPPNEDPLPNVLGMVTFLKQLFIAPLPIVAVKLMMRGPIDINDRLPTGRYKPLKGKKKDEARAERDAGFVDIIAAGGEEWIRIYSKKHSHLLSEFREQDSYCNSDFDSDSDSETNAASTSRTTPPLNNSLLTLVDNLMTVAKSCERPPGTTPPRVTLRLARIDEFPAGGHEDDRIPATFKAIRDRGVNLVFGDLDEYPLELPNTLWTDKPLRPSTKINLDPTALLGICSDLLHYPLPADEEETRKRFFRPEEYLIPGREGRAGNEGSGSWKGQSQNSRDLVKGTLDETHQPLITEIRDKLDSLEGDVEFWATEDAIRHVHEALGSEEVVGDGLEQRRMRRMLGIEEGDFFEGSRYEGQEGRLKGFRVNVFPPDSADPTSKAISSTSNGAQAELTTNGKSRHDKPGLTTFHHLLASSCSQFLREYYVSLDRPDSHEAQVLPSFLHHRKLPVAKVAQLSKPFTIVSLGSLARGGAEGMTTLCMGNITFRDLWNQSRWKPRGWHQGNYEVEKANADGTRGNAAIWLLPYRCMGEGKRVKFEKGDYSYPT